MTPPITKNLMIINGILFMAMMVGERWNFDLNQLLGLHFVLASNFQPFQLLTYMFMHANITHIFFNMFSLWMFGRIIESVLGGKRFLIFYLLCGIIAGISQEIVQLISYYAQGLNNYEMVNLGTHSMPMSQFLSTWTTIGASGCVYGVLVAYGMLFPNERVLLLIPPTWAELPLAGCLSDVIKRRSKNDIPVLLLGKSMNRKRNHSNKKCMTSSLKKKDRKLKNHKTNLKRFHPKNLITFWKR